MLFGMFSPTDASVSLLAKTPPLFDRFFHQAGVPDNRKAIAIGG
jgi:hypothetical protein